MARVSYEYGIAFHRNVIAGEAHEAHREGMTRQQAQDWLRTWKEGFPMSEVFVMIRRPTAKWEVAKW